MVSPSESISRCFVVVSVTLGGTRSPVLYFDSAETKVVCGDGNSAFGVFVRTFRSFGANRTPLLPTLFNWRYCAIPLPMNIKAGIIIQNHQPGPLPVTPKAIEITRNAMPMKNFVIALSSVIGLPLRPISGCAAGSFPESASETFPRSVPQLLQNFPVSGF